MLKPIPGNVSKMKTQRDLIICASCFHELACEKSIKRRILYLISLKIASVPYRSISKNFPVNTKVHTEAKNVTVPSRLHRHVRMSHELAFLMKSPAKSSNDFDFLIYFVKSHPKMAKLNFTYPKWTFFLV